LNFRATQRELFDSGDYSPLKAIGKHQTHVCAFERKWSDRAMVVIVPRLVFGLTGGAELPPIGEVWKDSKVQLPRARAGDLFRNVLTREMVPAIELGGNAAVELCLALKTFPVALLENI
jgi:(1->4)-alpha-D-glucan 1-alpha-D-glucosylmutase